MDELPNFQQEAVISFSPGRILLAAALLPAIAGAAYFAASAVMFLCACIRRRSKGGGSSGFCQDGAPRSERSAPFRSPPGGRLPVWRRVSLKSRLMLFSVLLSELAVLLAAVPFGRGMIRREEELLSEGLREKAGILLSGLASGAKAYMPSCAPSELDSFLRRQVFFTGVEFATIAGRSRASVEGAGGGSLLHVWASTDPAILSKIDTAELEPGVSRIRPECRDVQCVEERCLALDRLVGAELGGLLNAVRGLEAERDAAFGAPERLRGIGRQISELAAQLDASLERFSREGSGSVPGFGSSSLRRGVSEYVFYRPILFRSGDSSDLVQGIVFVKVDAASLVEDARSAAEDVIASVCAAALLAAALGAIGAAAASRIIFSPIKRLEASVGLLASERRKERPAGGGCNPAADDEIGRLFGSVSRLKEELAAAAASDLLQNDGKAVQKSFLPLERADGGRARKTTARLHGNGFNCFGYYEGAAAVSGDYFDFKNLDGRWYALIKSDASGHGTPAALIMTVVATLFNRFFADWTYRRCGTRIDRLVCEANDFLESLCLDGKFAAITVCLYDSDSGDVFVCNAGDSLLHIFDAAAGRIRTVRLAEAPAAGAFNSRMFGGMCGFQVEKVRLNPGDVLFLYTDGIEESSRFVRDSQFQKIHVEEGGRLEEGRERFGARRVRDVIESVLTRGTFVLSKARAAAPVEELPFDFRHCGGTGEEAVVALASVEKVFRMYRPDGASAADAVVVDRKVDGFLKEHFNLYESYCRRSEASVPDDAAQNYAEYGFVMEDDQTDDIAILSLHRL